MRHSTHHCRGHPPPPQEDKVAISSISSLMPAIRLSMPSSKRPDSRTAPSASQTQIIVVPGGRPSNPLTVKGTKELNNKETPPGTKQLKVHLRQKEPMEEQSFFFPFIIVHPLAHSPNQRKLSKASATAPPLPPPPASTQPEPTRQHDVWDRADSRARPWR